MSVTSFRIAGSIVQPLRALSDGAKRLSEGEREVAEREKAEKMVQDAIKTKVDDRGAKLVDQFNVEAAALVEANPPGSSALEKTDCSKYEEYFARYGKGGELYKAKNRK